MPKKWGGGGSYGGGVTHLYARRRAAHVNTRAVIANPPTFEILISCSLSYRGNVMRADAHKGFLNGLSRSSNAILSNAVLGEGQPRVHSTPSGLGVLLCSRELG